MSQINLPLTELSNISKSFGPNKVLMGVNVELLPDEIHALTGELQ